VGEDFFVVGVDFAVEVVFCGFFARAFFGASAEGDDFGVGVCFECGDVFS